MSMSVLFDVETFLVKSGIPFEAISFKVERGDGLLRINDGSIDPHTVYKTLALTGSSTGPLIAVVPLDTRLSYKKLAKVSGNRTVGLIPEDRLEETTGYIHGTNNPLGIWFTKQYPIFIDQQSIEPKRIYVSSGHLGRGVKIDIIHLTDLVDAKLYDLVE
ncbi:YbaK/EbsC family protein [Vibrio viridaestus]|uniref:Cys-tRNA(Pro)/Cys-tRNA(Cys) deacylase n=1 Tax=Vibrio viridaestus TaxID=2487322 RepID=A0A3N9TFS3_9VIBR|nr:YbaK/EbsC family protein [Vibrio viridaestus]RQW62325.1 Cys-tRNA(Pro) deacylase [Vibrio viridaestus]